MKEEVEQFIIDVINSDITPELSERGRNLLNQAKTPVITNRMLFEDIIDRVHIHFMLDPLESLKSRKREIVVTRQVCMYVLNRETTYSLSEIGAKFNKDHSTVHHACKTISNLIDTDRRFYEVHKEMLKYRPELFNDPIKPELP